MMYKLLHGFSCWNASLSCLFALCAPANVLHFVNNLQRRLKGRVMTHSLLDVDVFPTPKLLYTHEFIIITWLLDKSLVYGNLMNLLISKPHHLLKDRIKLSQHYSNKQSHTHTHTYKNTFLDNQIERNHV